MIEKKTASHPGCWLIPLTAKCVKTLALINTGASVTMMGLSLDSKVQQVHALRLQGKYHDLKQSLVMVSLV